MGGEGTSLRARASRASSSSAGLGGTAGGGGKEGRRGKYKNGKKKNPGRRKNLKSSRSTSRKEQGTAFRGASMAPGTSRMGGSFAPVTHFWKTRDMGGEEDSGGEEEEQDIEEERRRSRQRGGTQPSLRDRRPPPSRDLGLSRPGDMPGKGRGGPTPPKKSRGTGAMILGTPIPDTIKGLPNPGTSRVETVSMPPGRNPGKPSGEKLNYPGKQTGVPGSTSPVRMGEERTIEKYFILLRSREKKNRRKN